MKTEVKNLPGELLLLVMLVTLWGASYSFIKIGVVFLDETLTSTAWIGLLCLIAGVVAMTIPAAQPKG